MHAVLGTVSFIIGIVALLAHNRHSDRPESAEAAGVEP
jgi:hypothetical protein